MNTIPGGLYLSEDGVTYHDANGNVIKPTKAQLSEYEALHAEWSASAVPIVPKPGVEASAAELKAAGY